MNVFEPDGGARIWRRRCNLDVRHLDVLEMTDEEPFGRRGAEATGVGIAVFVFGDLDGTPVGKRLRVVPGAEGRGQASVGEIAVVHLDVLNKIGWDA